jgi:hypothetical protein
MQPGVRLAEVVGSLSLATGLCTGQPIEHGLRRSLLAVWLGEELGLGVAELSETNRRVWAALPGDCIVLDTEGAVWTPGWTETGPACLRVAEGGELLDTVPLDRGRVRVHARRRGRTNPICARGGTGECRTASRTTSRA